MSKACKFMLACLVHKDNKDILSKPTKLAPGRTRKNTCQEKEKVLAEERAKAKAECPVPASNERYGDVDHAIKKAKVAGMQSHAEKIAVDSIISQVNVLRENVEFYNEFHGEERYKSMIVNLLNQLPGVPKTAGTVSSGQSSTPASRRGIEVNLTGNGNNKNHSDLLSVGDNDTT
jgi:hypothetical protein